MLTRNDLPKILEDTLKELGGEGTVISVYKHIWRKYKDEIESSGLSYTWQCDIRWAAARLRKKKIMKGVQDSPPHIWQLAS